MKKEHTKKLQALEDKVTELQNRCNRAQEFIIQAREVTTDKAVEAMIKEAELSLAN